MPNWPFIKCHLRDSSDSVLRRPSSSGVSLNQFFNNISISPIEPKDDFGLVNGLKSDLMVVAFIEYFTFTSNPSTLGLGDWRRIPSGLANDIKIWIEGVEKPAGRNDLNCLLKVGLICFFRKAWHAIDGHEIKWNLRHQKKLDVANGMVNNCAAHKYPDVIDRDLCHSVVEQYVIKKRALRSVLSGITEEERARLNYPPCCIDQISDALERLITRQALLYMRVKRLNDSDTRNEKMKQINKLTATSSLSETERAMLIEFLLCKEFSEEEVSGILSKL